MATISVYKLNQAGEQIQYDLDLTEHLFPMFSTGLNYKIDDVVVYNGGLYQCISPVTSGSLWDSSKWALKTVDQVFEFAITAEHKLDADKVDDSSATNKFVTVEDKAFWTAKIGEIELAGEPVLPESGSYTVNLTAEAIQNVLFDVTVVPNLIED